MMAHEITATLTGVASSALFGAEEMKMQLTKNGKYIHYAVQVEYTDGPFVVLLTHVPEVADQVAAQYAAENIDEGHVNVDVIQFEAGQEVWLGFPFSHCGAVRLDESA